jgi:hypothetical protein
MDLFRGKRNTDRGSPARAGQKSINRIHFNPGYRSAPNPIQVKAALKRLTGTDKEIAEYLVRRLDRSKGFVSSHQLISDAYMFIATKYPHLRQIDVMMVLGTLLKEKAISRSRQMGKA